MIDPVTVQKIKDSADIVDVVSDYVHLVRRGANYMGLCPFHNERTPSFSVNKSRNFCYCFSCHKGGGPINFIMEKEGISYHEALLQLAKKYGIEVQERELSPEEREKQSRREGMLIANEWAKNYFISNLEKEEGKDVGLTYIYNRKVTPEAIKAFALGYAIDKGNDYTQAALQKGFSLDILKAVGLTGTSQQGHNYDKYRGRVIFPIINTSGKTVGFGGRDLKGGPAKYINSPESEVYIKNRELYGIYQAKGDIVKEDKCYLVEGYLDVISFWQSGVKNTVASSGTALTDGQISLIHRFTENVTLVYDGDPAGIKASLRGIDMFLAHGLNVKAVLLPDGDDPDSLAAKLTPEELKEFLKENETDIIKFKIKVLLEDTDNDPQKRWEVTRSIVNSISHIADKIKRDIYIQECSEILGIKESTLSSAVAKARFQIVEQEKQRRRRVINQTESDEQPAVISEQGKSSETRIPLKQSPLFPLEKEVLYNVLKYGFLDLVYSEDSISGEDKITVVEYVAEELEVDEIKFTHPEYSKVFEFLLSSLPDYKKELKKKEESIQQLIEQKRRDKRNEIAGSSISMTEIQRAEKALEEELKNIEKEERDNFAKNYVPDVFGNHEDPLVRKHSIAAVAEKHRLSPMFRKNQEQGSESVKILNTVINSINVLKNGIIDLQLNSLMDELKALTDSDSEKERELHSKITAIIQMRSRMAKDIGDRIINPVSHNSYRK